MRTVLPSGQQVERPTQPGTKWTDEEIKQAVAPMRVRRKLTPQSWPNGAAVAVCLSWDMDNESFELAAGNTAPIALSLGEYGTKQALPRILKLHDEYKISGSFYIPGVTGLLYPELVTELKSRPQHEIGIHGWIHENPLKLNDAAEEERLLRKSIDFWTAALGKKPVGYRAPGWAWSLHTFDLIRKTGFEYDSSAMGMDEPYELLSYGQPTGMVELPVDWLLDDAPYFWWPGAALPSPKLAFEVLSGRIRPSVSGWDAVYADDAPDDHGSSLAHHLSRQTNRIYEIETRRLVCHGTADRPIRQAAERPIIVTHAESACGVLLMPTEGSYVLGLQASVAEVPPRLVRHRSRVRPYGSAVDRRPRSSA